MFEAFQRAVRIAGSQAKFAALVGSTQQGIWYLLSQQRPLPAKYVLRAEAGTCVPRWELRPDIYPPDLEAGPEASAQAA